MAVLIPFSSITKIRGLPHLVCGGLTIALTVIMLILQTTTSIANAGTGYWVCFLMLPASVSQLLLGIFRSTRFIWPSFGSDFLSLILLCIGIGTSFNDSNNPQAQHSGNNLRAFQGVGILCTLVMGITLCHLSMLTSILLLSCHPNWLAPSCLSLETFTTSLPTFSPFGNKEPTMIEIRPRAGAYVGQREFNYEQEY
ncbi:hypothetical protein Ciccas_002380 [Cichlidogyrus casuarinus]|uniref:Uncharacterized protein n=1 Tax=Cichlidogyrus casuarinus TaxID=1844966 RepID=A0ABD2QKK0_9PLAT